MQKKYNPGDYVCVDKRHGRHGFMQSFIAAAIRFFTKSAYSHVFIVVSEDGHIVEAEASGARLTHIEEYGSDNLLFSNTNLTQQQRDIIVKSARSYVGTPYNFLDIVYLGLELRGIKWGWLLDEVLESKHMICSQLVAQCGYNAGVKSWLCGQQDPQQVTPGMLATLAVS